MSDRGSESENPVLPYPTPRRSNQDWWPTSCLQVLHQHSPLPNPLDEDFDYPAAFATLDLGALKRDVIDVMKRSQPWWPADYGHYGPLFIRLTWHAAGTYRIDDGRGGGGGGMQRFAPLNSWPDNANLDKARRLLWPVKQKYGRKISWADLLVFAGNMALEDMGFATFGFGFGRPDISEPEEIFWGAEDTWLGDERYSGERDLADPLGAVQMGLIYVNPEGPGGNPDPLAAARDIRETFARMAMNDEETVALIAGGHTFGKCHGAVAPENIGPEPEGCPFHTQGLGWHNKAGTGRGVHTITSGLEGAWTNDPARWDHGFFENLFAYEWELTRSPAGAQQWRPVNPEAQGTVPDAHDPTRRHAPMMLTTDLALRLDPIYGPISKRFHEHPDQFADAFAKAWYKLLHRDMGPTLAVPGPPHPRGPALAGPGARGANGAHRRRRRRGAETRAARQRAVGVAARVDGLGLGGELPRHRQTRRRQRGSPAPGAPARTGRSTSPDDAGRGAGEARAGEARLRRPAATVARRSRWPTSSCSGGCAAVEKAARDAGFEITVPFAPGRTDASQAQTDVASFAVLEPRADGFRNYSSGGGPLSPAQRLIDRANLLSLTASEMTALVGGMRVLGVNHGGARHGVFTDRVGQLTRDFFVHLLDMRLEWTPSATERGVYEGRDRDSGATAYTATEVDLVFGAHSQLRGLAEIYACDDGDEKFVRDFVAAWDKVMNLDRFDLG